MDLRLILHLAAFLCLAFTVSCTWNKKDRDETENHFKAYQKEYLLCAKEFSAGAITSLPKNARSSLEQFSGGFEVSPIDYYYSIVYVADKKVLKNSRTVADEGSVLKSLGDGFYLVQRGWM